MFDVFESEFAYKIFKQKYSMKGEEKWEDTIDRVVTAAGYSYIKPFMLNREFIPGGRYLYAAGRPLHPIKNCFAMTAEDSREGWAKLVYDVTMTLMLGGGIGIEYSKIRPKGSVIKSTGGEASGVVSLMTMIDSIAHEIQSGGSRRCLPENSLVHTSKGLIEIKDIVIGETVVTTKGIKKVINKFDQGKQNLISIITQCGKFSCTPNHKMAVIIDSKGNYIWKPAIELKKEDRLYFSNTPILGKPTQLLPYTEIPNKHATTRKTFIVPNLTTDVSWFLGYLHGNGRVYLKEHTPGKLHGSVRCACPKTRPDIADKLMYCFKLFNLTPTQKQGDGEVWNIGTSSTEFAKYMQNYKKSKECLKIPECILQGTIQIRGAYVAGIFDADGSNSHRPVTIAASVYPSYLQQLQSVCSSLGIATRFKLARGAKGNWKALYHLNVCGKKQMELFDMHVLPYVHKQVEIHRSRQQYSYSLPGKFIQKGRSDYSIEYVENTVKDPLKTFTPVKVLCIVQEDTIVQTYDIEVEDAHEFFVNGLLTHNSALWGGVNWKHQEAKDFFTCKIRDTLMLEMKKKDFNFRMPLEMTNISVQYDDSFLANPDMGFWYNHMKAACQYGEPGYGFNFGTNKDLILRNACNEFISETNMDSCNLGSIFINRIKDKDHMAKVVKHAVKFLLRGQLYSDLPTEEAKKVTRDNNRIGLGLAGVGEWLLARQMPFEPNDQLRGLLEVYADVADTEARKYAKVLGLNSPKATRAIAPAGSIGCLGGSTFGMEPMYCKSYIKSYWKDNKYISEYVVDACAKRLLDSGIESSKIYDAYDISFENRIKFQAFLQEYVDMGISSTCNLPAWGSEGNNFTNVKEKADILLKYATKLRGFTIYPDGAIYGQPMVRCSLEEALSKQGTLVEMNENGGCKSGVCGI